jgi:glycosyltransferase involved in cell wall biosynthesis
VKILHIIDHMGLGGAQSILLDLLELHGRHHDLALMILANRILEISAKRLTAANIPYQILGATKYNPIDFLRLRQNLAKIAPEIVVTHLEFSNTFGIAAALSLGRSCPLLVQFIDNDPSQHYSLLHRLAGRLLAPWVDVHIAISESLRRSTLKTFCGRIRRIEVIPPGLDTTRFNALKTDSNHSEVFREGASRVIGAIGRLSEQKAFDVLIRAMPNLLASDANTRLLIVGDGSLRHRLEKEVETLGLSKAVKFLGLQSDPVPIYRAMDIFVLPSKHEGFGLVLAEAMAMGIPVVGTRVVGTVDAVEDGISGLLVPYGDVEALSNAILRIFSEPELRHVLIQNGRSRVRQYFTKEIMAAKTEALFEELKDNCLA